MSSRVTRSSTAAAAAAGKDTPETSSKGKKTASPSKPKIVALSSSTTPSTNPKPQDAKSVFFWREYGDKNCYLSQWYASPFHTGDPKGTVYQTAEQYMMHQKALLFSDYAIASKILQTSSPKAVKGLGRKVKGFSESVWLENRSRIVAEASYYKFKYGADKGELQFDGYTNADGSKKTLRDRLLDTGDREIVEASPMDRIWGIGFAASGAEEYRDNWGLNLLGIALMEAREKLRGETAEGEK